MSTPVHIWPDGTYCTGEELEEMLTTGHSDDYETIEVPYEVDDVDTYVHQYLMGEHDG